MFAPSTPITPAVPLDERNRRPLAARASRDGWSLDTEDASDDDDFSRILWQVVKGFDKPYPVRRGWGCSRHGAGGNWRLA